MNKKPTPSQEFRMSGWKVIVITLILLILAGGIYMLAVDRQPTATLSGTITNAASGAPIADVLIYSHWVGAKFGERGDGALTFSEEYVKSDHDGRYVISGIVPGFNCRGIRWLHHQTIKFCHPLYQEQTIFLYREELAKTATEQNMALKPAQDLTASETELQRFLNDINGAFGPQPDSLLNQATAKGLRFDYNLNEIITFWDKEVLGKLPQSKLYRYRWLGIRDRMRRAYQNQ